MTAFHTLLPTKLFPIAILFISVPPEEMDVNVHPTKKEVKFARDREVYNAVVTAVRGGIISSSETKTNDPFHIGHKQMSYTPSDHPPLPVYEKKQFIRRKKRNAHFNRSGFFHEK